MGLDNDIRKELDGNNSTMLLQINLQAQNHVRMLIGRAAYIGTNTIIDAPGEMVYSPNPLICTGNQPNLCVYGQTVRGSRSSEKYTGRTFIDDGL